MESGTDGIIMFLSIIAHCPSLDLHGNVYSWESSRCDQCREAYQSKPQTAAGMLKYATRALSSQLTVGPKILKKYLRII